MEKIIRFFGVITLVAVFGFFLVSCDDDNDSQGGKAYFKNANDISSKNALSARSVIEAYDIEFLVYRLMLKDDTGEGGVWVIGGNQGGIPGWYDIDGIQKANFGNQPQGRSHSCVFLTISAIKINDKLYHGTGGSGMNPFLGNKEDITTNPHQGGHGFGIIAGDINKLGPGELTFGDEKEISFQGVNNMQNIDEFIIIIDTSKLHNDEILASNWWECFSFIVR